MAMADSAVRAASTSILPYLEFFVTKVLPIIARLRIPGDRTLRKPVASAEPR